MNNITNSDKIYFFTFSISYLECLALYSSVRHSVILVAESGEKVQVPASRLKAFIDSRGISGRFRLVITAQNKIKSFERLR
ncbi:DUF2835 family protein [Aestuariibacter sp. A3R04]|nr:DUF2835 family protein [Aestuariibacter sp. A3R04]MBU3022906.1 DUF2835 family protein [Aestuariibacter sp. A3R04]